MQLSADKQRWAEVVKTVIEYDNEVWKAQEELQQPADSCLLFL